MIDHVLGRPSPAIRRTQIFLVLFFWVWRLYKGDGSHPTTPTPTLSARRSRPSGRIASPGIAPGGLRGRRWLWRIWIALVGKRRFDFPWVRKINERLKNFTPYQLVLGTLTIMYALRHLDDLFGLGAPEPLASLYTRSYYRATYVNTAFDAGFASAMSIRPKWLKDICSMAFSVYYLVWANEGDDVLRRFRAICSVEMLRVTWEKTRNPYVRLFTAHHRPSLTIVRSVTIPRPPSSSRASLPPVKGLLFFSGTEEQFAASQELVVDFPGGGFIAMGPDCHEERLRRWARRTNKPILGIDYGKAPEFPYPWAIEEGFDAYRTLHETRGSCIGIKAPSLSIVLTGDSAGGNICATIMLRILEHHTMIPRPVSMILAYPALDFNFTSWMSPANLKVLRTEQSESHLTSLKHGKDHLAHKSPLSVVDDLGRQRSRSKSGRQKSWADALSSKFGMTPTPSPAIEDSPLSPVLSIRRSNPTSPTTWTKSLPRVMSTKIAGWLAPDHEQPIEDHTKESDPDVSDASESEAGTGSDDDEEDEEDEAATVRPFRDLRKDSDKPLKARVKTPMVEKDFDLPPVIVESPQTTPEGEKELAEPEGKKVVKQKRRRAPIGTRLTMTSRVGYFQDRIISPSMMRAMAILYIGPKRNPDFETDYYISPILAPSHLLAHFPPVYLICGERDPFVDDTVIFAGKIREAKRARRAEAEFAARKRSARSNEGLRITTSRAKQRAANDAPGAERSSTSNGPDHILRETDDDWVCMRIIEGWGHGFMQMASLMTEVDSVLTEMADYIDESFSRAVLTQADIRDVAHAHQAAQGDSATLPPETSLPPAHASHVKPVREYNLSSDPHVGGADLGAPLGRETPSGDIGSDEGLITFTPKSKRRPTPPSKFVPVPRRPSKETLQLVRNLSAPKFDIDEAGSSGETFALKTPPAVEFKAFPPNEQSGKGAFAFFNARAAAATQGRKGKGPAVSVSKPITPIHSSHGNGAPGMLASGSRTGSSASVPVGKGQSVGMVSEAELMRRRRLEAVLGMGDLDSNVPSDEDGEGELEGDEGSERL